ncbi:MAG: prepilin-type N-terminal cleavage/methylation domain-containing protein [Pirellulales bacterium]|nr:prepilin-type N-terminal cleavage/methylation domain-containing protein [Pirellulales bacterium]
MKKQAGYTLIEMCIAMAVLAMTLTLGASVLHGLIGVNQTTQKGLAEQVVFERLAGTFRDDVRAADELVAVPAAEDASPSKQWELKRDGAPAVRYRLEEDRLVRTVETPDGTIRERFDLPENASVAIEPQRQGEATLVALIVVPGLTAADAPRGPLAGLRVEAQLARDRSGLQAPPSKSEVTTEPREEPSDE